MKLKNILSYQNFTMQTYYLSNQNPTFTLKGEEEKMSAEILKVILKNPVSGKNLDLEVTDENGFLLYSKALIPKPPAPDSFSFNEFPEVPINKRFIFSSCLRIGISAPANTIFQVEVQCV
ncbi:hypothetical protein [Adhaeribacter terreus]|uniref:Uncharacterized protein n=1 Tax=Adhaeribacter terreus TaxID=529703 RepID=A0ABW0EAU5_9BACT